MLHNCAYSLPLTGMIKFLPVEYTRKLDMHDTNNIINANVSLFVTLSCLNYATDHH